MDDFNIKVGARLKKVRHIFNEGGRLTAEQFAYLIGETGDKIRNYELGRSTLPLRILWLLYERGINPVFIISGEGSVFADNEAGRSFRSKVESRKKLTGDIELIRMPGGDAAGKDKSYRKREISEKQELPVYRAAAGRIQATKKNENK